MALQNSSGFNLIANKAERQKKFNQYKSDPVDEKIKVETNLDLVLARDHAQRNLTLKKTIFIEGKNK